MVKLASGERRSEVLPSLKATAWQAAAFAQGYGEPGRTDVCRWKFFLAVERANLRSRFRSETNTSIALVPFSDPRTRLSRFAFASNSFVALERTLFVDFTSLFFQPNWE
jgi:hypothetical protein